MDVQKPTPQDEADARPGSDGTQGLNSALVASDADIEALQADLLRATRKRPRRRLVVVALVAAAAAAAWFGYNAFTPPVAKTHAPASGPAVASSRATTDRVLTAKPLAPEPRGVSWAAAEKAFAAGQYAVAMQQYKRLAEMTTTATGPTAISELFKLRIADCLLKIEMVDEYRQQLSSLDEAASPLIYSLVNYRLAELDCRQELWLQGRTRAYRALAAGGLTGAAEPLQGHCWFLIARCLTQQTLRMSSVDAAIAWSDEAPTDPLTTMDEQTLTRAILHGAQTMGKAALGPAFEKRGTSAAGLLWEALCWRSPIDQTFGRFAHQSGLNVQWVSVAPAVRERPVTLLTDGMPQRRLLETAAGAAGLVARFEGTTIHVHDFSAAESLTQQQQMLASEASAAWTRLAMSGADSARGAEGQYALGILRECAKDPAGAIAEHRQVALRFPRSRVAPHALMRSAKANLALRDYTGAKDDLTNLMDTYPEHPGMEQVFLLLARAYSETGRTGEAVTLLRKVYLLDRSLETKIEAALWAGRCCSQGGDHVEAIQWLGRYLEAARPRKHAEIASAYLLMARSHRAGGDLAHASRALRNCLSNHPTPEIERSALVELARAEADQLNLVAAAGACGVAAEKASTPAQRDEVVLLRAQIYRQMGLAEKGVSELRKHLGESASEQGVVPLAIELARCYQDAGSDADARAVLNDLLARVKNDREAQDIRCQLAELSVKLERNKEAIVLLEDTLRGAKDTAVRRRCYQTLAAAYLAEKDFAGAATAMAAAGAGGPPR